MLDFIQRGAPWHSSKLANFKMLNKHYVTGILFNYMYIHVQAPGATSGSDLHIFVGHLPTPIPLCSVASHPPQVMCETVTCSSLSIVCYAHVHALYDYCNVQKITTIHVHALQNYDVGTRLYSVWFLHSYLHCQDSL